MALPLAPAFAPEVGAAVLCERKNRVKIRPDTCKGKETQVQDLQALGGNVQQLDGRVQQLEGRAQQLDGSVQQLGGNVQQLSGNVRQLGDALDVQAGQLGTEAARLDAVVGQLRLVCENAPNLVKADADESFYHDSIECGGGCRTHDGDQAACQAAWAVSEAGATSCVFFKDLCLPCAGCVQEQGLCTNHCRPQVNVTCPNDLTRTVFAGGPGSNACQRFETQAECAQAFHADQQLRPATCFWTGSECRGCGPRNENDGDCTNTCRTIGCADPTRTTLRECNDVGNDQAACEQTWHFSGNEGEPASCFFDAAASRCRGCGFPNELRGKCDNICR